jgi:hypothetical protein
VADSGHLHVHLWGELHGGIRALGLRLGQSKDFVLTQASHDISGIDLGSIHVITIGANVRVGVTAAVAVCITVAVCIGVGVAFTTAAAFTIAAAFRLAVNLGELCIIEQVKYFSFGHRVSADLCFAVSGFVEGFLHLTTLSFGLLNFLAGLRDLLLA